MRCARPPLDVPHTKGKDNKEKKKEKKEIMEERGKKRKKKGLAVLDGGVFPARPFALCPLDGKLLQLAMPALSP